MHLRLQRMDTTANTGNGVAGTSIVGTGTGDITTMMTTNSESLRIAEVPETRANDVCPLAGRASESPHTAVSSDVAQYGERLQLLSDATGSDIEAESLEGPPVTARAAHASGADSDAAQRSPRSPILSDMKLMALSAGEHAGGAQRETVAAPDQMVPGRGPPFCFFGRGRSPNHPALPKLRTVSICQKSLHGLSVSFGHTTTKGIPP
ncbi:hypothetical protein GGD68_003349 [Paraburkholderia fungorum]|jgi:hypothetical protein|uniref:Uncharacterized protein n=1 Tax=Paraburkholderia fungorum TaxID=134537 RepID=A0AAW3UWG8_9BURK|nr:hypothetical protein [Paraburkholderia fungorum]MBB6202518.1 hypothetical protein [Paraburkholderia fungorum]